MSREPTRQSRTVAPAILLILSVAVSLAAAWRLEALHRRPENSLPYFLAFGLAFVLSILAGRMAPARPDPAPAGRTAPASAHRKARSFFAAAALGSLALFGWAWMIPGRLFPLRALAVWASALALGAVAWAAGFSRGKESGDRGTRTPAAFVLAFLFVLSLGAWARLVELGRVPPIFGCDEASQVEDGISLVRGGPASDPFGTGWYGTMRLGMLPAGVAALRSEDLVAGPRLPYAIAGVLAVVTCGAAAGVAAGAWAALGCAALLAFSPHHVHFSRLSSVMVLDSLSAGATAFLLLLVFRYRSPFWGYLAGVSAGISLYGYAGGRVVALTFFAGLVWLLLRPVGGRSRLTLFATMAAGLALAAAPNVRFAIQNFPEWNQRFYQVGVLNPDWWREAIRLHGSAVKILVDQFLGGTIGLLSQHSTTSWYYGYPIVAPIVLPALAIAGLGWLAGRRQYFAAMLLALLAAGNIAGLVLTVPSPTPQRASSLMPVLAVLGGVAIAGFVGLFPSRGRRPIPWRGAAGTLIVGGLLVSTFRGLPGSWEPSPRYGGEPAALTRSAYELLRAHRYHGESIFLNGRPYLDSSVPCFRYFLSRTRWVDVETRPEAPPISEPGFHLFAAEWIPTALAWKAKLRIPFGVALPEPGDPTRNSGYLLRIPLEASGGRP